MSHTSSPAANNSSPPPFIPKDIPTSKMAVTIGDQINVPRRSTALNHGPTDQLRTQNSDPSIPESTIRRFLQRVLLFRHACTCKAPDRQCKVISKCDKTKQLVRHVQVCKKKDCPVPHCNSSRTIMNHYVGCEEKDCPLCAPVRRKKTRTSHRSKIRLQPSSRCANNIPSAISSISIPPPKITELESTMSAELHYFWDHDHKTYPSCHMVSLSSSKRKQKRALSSEDSAEQRYLKKRIGMQRKYSCNTAVETKPSSTKDLLLHTHIPLVPSFTSIIPTAKLDPKVLSKQKVETLSGCKIQSVPKDFKDKYLIILRVLQSQSNCWLFTNPVDPVECKIPDYFEVITKPMDLGTVLKKVESGEYPSIEEFKADVCLTFDNAIMYNAEDSIVQTSAIEYKKKFLSEYNKMVDQIKAEDTEYRISSEHSSNIVCNSVDSFRYHI